MQFDHLAVGGTFDLFHAGHKNFLKDAFNLAKKVTVGVTSDEMAVDLGKNTFYSYEKRERDVREFLEKFRLGAPWQIIKIGNVFGTTTQDATIDAICVTENTYDGAVKINQARTNLNMKPVEIVNLPLSLASDGKPISSTRIRTGEINQNGLNYFMYISSFATSKLTKKVREELAKPQGKLYSNLRALMNEGSPDSGKLISVGDRITYNLIIEKVFPRLAIVDFKIERKEVFKNLAGIGFSDNQIFIGANNPPGEITRDLVKKLHTFFDTKNGDGVVVIKGEEDLSVLPAALMSPLGYRIIYGQRNRGIVSVDVDPLTKERFLALFNEFEKDI